jgi:hypothetical protein
MVDTRADRLLFFHPDKVVRTAKMLFIGPEYNALAPLTTPWMGQRMVSVAQVFFSPTCGLQT